MSDIRQITREFVGRSVRADGLADNDDIFARGFVNSLFAMQLVMFVENEFGVSIENDDLDMDNFRSIEAIASFVKRKRAGVGPKPES